VLVRLEEISTVQLVLFDRTSSYHELTSALFRAAGVEPAGIMELDNVDATKKMVMHGLGVAFLPAAAVAAELESGALRAVALADAEPVRRQIVVVRRRDAGRPTGLVAAFMRTLQEVSPHL
jgi:DNA-binding transcriptional LysR family regulator